MYQIRIISYRKDDTYLHDAYHKYIFFNFFYVILINNFKIRITVVFLIKNFKMDILIISYKNVVFNIFSNFFIINFIRI